MKIVSNNLPKQLFLALCALFVVVSTLEAGCMGGSCRKKQARTQEARGCATGNCRK
jgi:hypothetical protein